MKGQNDHVVFKNCWDLSLLVDSINPDYYPDDQTEQNLCFNVCSLDNFILVLFFSLKRDYYIVNIGFYTILVP